MYKTTDGGATWTHLGFSTFQGMRIRSIIPTKPSGGQTVFAATTETRGPGTGGVYRSDNGGTTWNRVSGSVSSRLPDAAVSHLALFPIDATTVGFYTAVVSGPGRGIYRSTDNGTSWQLISNNIVDSVGLATRIEFSVSAAGNKPVYAGLISTDDFGSDRLLNVFRSVRGTDLINNNNSGGVDEPAEATWTAIGSAPNINPGGSGLIHFSILADKNVDNIVYVGGDSFTAGFGLARGNSTTNTWAAISQAGANNTNPHPDSRDMVFAGNDILQSDDGGIYRLVNPRGLAGTATVWTSVLGDLRNSELLAVALDNRNNTNPADDVILAGVMDNGSVERSATGQWAEAKRGDGLIVQADDANTPSVHYFTSQFFGFANRVGTDPVTFPSAEVLKTNRNGSRIRLNQQFDSFAFKAPYQLNATDPSRILVASLRNLYESSDQGETFLSLGGVIGVDRPGRVFPDGTGFIVSMANGSAGNPEVAYVGTDNSFTTGTGEIFLRTQPPPSFEIDGTPVPAPFVRTRFSNVAHDVPLDIVIDPDNPLVAYAITKNAVFMTVNGMDWTPLTDDLNQLALPGSGINLRTVELFTKLNHADVLLVGGLGGVFKRRVDAGAGPKWSEYGAGLPNVLVTDMEYDEKSDTLLAGTLGRGAWTVPVGSSAGLESIVRVDGTAADDTIVLNRNANPSLLDVSAKATALSPAAKVTVALSVVQRVVVNGGLGADLLLISSSGGRVNLANGIVFNGGDGSGKDTLQFLNTTDVTDTITKFNSGGIIASGLIGSLISAGTVTLSGVEAVTIQLGSGNDVVDAAATSIPVTLVGGPGSDTLTGGSGPDTLDSRDGSGNDFLFGGPGNDTALMDAGDFFNGGADEDGIHFFGTPGSDHIRVSRQVGPDGAQAVVEQNNQVQVFNYLQGETISVFAGAGNDHVTVDASVTTWRAELFGEQGNDRLYGGPLNDLLDGGPGNDFLDGGAGDNVLIGGGGHDVLQNGHAPVAALAATGDPSVAPALAGTSTNSISAAFVQVPAQLDSRSRKLVPSRIDLDRAALGKFFQQLADKNTRRSRAVLLQVNTLADGLDDELLDELTSGRFI